MSASLPYQPDAPVTRVGNTARALYWLAMSAGAASALLGILMLIWPDITLKVAAVLFGAWLLAHGLVRIVQAILSPAADTGSRAFTAIVGVLFLVAGILCLRNLLVSLAVLVTLVGLAWLVTGIVELGLVFISPSNPRYRFRGSVLSGILAILGGVALLTWPDMSLLTVVYLAGAWLIVTGILRLVMVGSHRALGP